MDPQPLAQFSGFRKVPGGTGGLQQSTGLPGFSATESFFSSLKTQWTFFLTDFQNLFSLQASMTNLHTGQWMPGAMKFRAFSRLARYFTNKLNNS